MMEGDQERDGSGPTSLSNVLADLFAVRGYGRMQAATELEQAWNAAVGESKCRETRVSGIKRGVLNITVAHPILLEELAGFRKSILLASMRTALPGAWIQDIRFRVGSVD